MTTQAKDKAKGRDRAEQEQQRIMTGGEFFLLNRVGSID